MKCKCPSILIVEDDEFIRVLTKTMVMKLGFDVKDVGHGGLAVEALEDQEARCTNC